METGFILSMQLIKSGSIRQCWQLQYNTGDLLHIARVEDVEINWMEQFC